MNTANPTKVNHNNTTFNGTVSEKEAMEVPHYTFRIHSPIHFSEVISVHFLRICPKCSQGIAFVKVFLVSGHKNKLRLT